MKTWATATNTPPSAPDYFIKVGISSDIFRLTADIPGYIHISILFYIYIDISLLYLYSLYRICIYNFRLTAETRGSESSGASTTGAASGQPTKVSRREVCSSFCISLNFLWASVHLGKKSENTFLTTTILFLRKPCASSHCRSGSGRGWWWWGGGAGGSVLQEGGHHQLPAGGARALRQWVAQCSATGYINMNGNTLRRNVYLFSS